MKEEKAKLPVGKQPEWKGMHNGSIRGKGFRIGRKTHAERRQEIVQRDIAKR